MKTSLAICQMRSSTILSPLIPPNSQQKLPSCPEDGGMYGARHLCLSFLGVEAKVPGINQTMVSYRALKLTSFRLDIAYPVSARQIKFAMSRSKAAPGPGPGPGPETGMGAGTRNIKLKICRYGYGIETTTIL
ncbi:hypothetical protein Bca4012_030284 [Brassica carinata]|uniref:Uncharacterized protein n=1 Tax=Brassica carinata TaxID=52824 RepID=A0A8X7RL29_BRACI|nr:hypothetical protein Bca52824_048409 [Brassica carinata]